MTLNRLWISQVLLLKWNLSHTYSMYFNLNKSRLLIGLQDCYIGLHLVLYHSYILTLQFLRIPRCSPTPSLDTLVLLTLSVYQWLLIWEGFS